MLDVAAVLDRLLDVSARAIAVPATWRSMLVFLTAPHDVGKISRSFQALAPTYWPLALGPFRRPPRAPRHDTLGWLILVERMSGDIEAGFPGWGERQLDSLLRAATGHHGRPPDESAGRLLSEVFCPQCEQAVRCRFWMPQGRRLRLARMGRKPLARDAPLGSQMIGAKRSLPRLTPRDNFGRSFGDHVKSRTRGPVEPPPGRRRPFRNRAAACWASLRPSSPELRLHVPVETAERGCYATGLSGRAGQGSNGTERKTQGESSGRHTQSTGAAGLSTPGASDLWLQNSAGATMHLRGTNSGAMLTLGRDEVFVQMSQ